MSFQQLLAGAGSLLNLPLALTRRRSEQWLDPARLERLRDQRLRRLLGIARRAPYYRRVIPAIPATATLQDVLARLPTLTKSILAAEGLNAFLTGDRAGLLSITTSGSTGEPAVFLHSPVEESEFSARWWRVYSAYGAGIRDTILYVGRTTGSARAGGAKMLRTLGLLPNIHKVSISAPVADAAAALIRVRPKVLNGFAIGIEALAEHVLQRGLEVPPPKAVICGAMDVSEHCREVAERAFRTRSVNVYVSNEFGVIAWECPEQRGLLHVNDDVLVLEILDGDRPVPDGVFGEVVITSLTLMRMPLIRYRMGDIAARMPMTCRCGRGLGLMSAVHGRTAHCIRGSRGRLMSTPLFTGVFGQCQAYEWARRFQIHEQADGVLRVLVVARRAPNDAETHRLLCGLREAVGDEFKPQIELRDDLPLTPGGKFQIVVPRTDSPRPG